MNDFEELLKCVSDVRKAFGAFGASATPGAIEACDELERLWGPLAPPPAARTRLGRESKPPRRLRADVDAKVSEQKSSSVESEDRKSSRTRTKRSKSETDENAKPVPKKTTGKSSTATESTEFEDHKPEAKGGNAKRGRKKTAETSLDRKPTESKDPKKEKSKKEAPARRTRTKNQKPQSDSEGTFKPAVVVVKKRTAASKSPVQFAKPDGESKDIGKRPTKAGRSSVEDSFFAHSPSSDKRNRKGETQLHAACTKSDLERARELLAQGANPNTKDHAGWTPLLEAVAHRNAALVALLVEHGACVDTPGPENASPMHEAMRAGDLDVIRLLAKHDADICTRNSKGVTPMQLATREMLAAFGEGGADVPERRLSEFNSSILEAELEGDVKIFPAGLSKPSATKLKSLLGKHTDKLSVETGVGKSTSFVLVDTSGGDSCPVNLHTLSALVHGVPIIDSNWLSSCGDTHLAKLRPFLVPSEGVRLAHANRLKLFPPLFDGCHFYFLDLNVSYEINAQLKVNKEILAKLVRDGGGVVLRREPDPEAIPEDEKVLPYHVPANGVLRDCSHFIVYRNRPKLAYNMKHLKSLPVGWLIDCIQNFKLVDP